MSNPTTLQRIFWVTLAAAAAPFAFVRLTSNRIIPHTLDVSFDEADLYDDLFDGEVAAEMN